LYERALPVVYGYLFDRCRDRATAEDLTSETFLAAARTVRGRPDDEVTVPWLVGVARHKLVDHWRRVARTERVLVEVAADNPTIDEPWDAHVDGLRATEVLEVLGAHHRAALTLRYVDGLPVREVADALGRTEHATEALLVRARRAFRQAYEEGEGVA
jgi:RNA polymerase sigma-70 factor (ECF subfamily)